MPQDLSAITWPVRTERLTIRPCTVEDLPGLFEIRRRPEVSDYLPTHPTDLDAFVERLSDPDRLAVTLALELGHGDDAVLIGDLYLAIGTPWAQVEVFEQAKDTQAEIGWVVAPEYGGQGLATEGAEALLHLCFEQLGLRRVKALAYADNVASVRIMQKLRMRREEYSVAESLHRSGRWLDGVGYAILAAEWRAH